MSSSRGRKKMVVVGDGDCGKSCLLVAYSQNEFPVEWDATIHNYRAGIICEGMSFPINWKDFHDPGDRLKIRFLSYVDAADVILVCFSIADPLSFASIYESWVSEVREFVPNVPIILVGNKKDLRNDLENIQNLKPVSKKTVTYEDGKAMARNIKAFAYLECSALTNEGMEEVFATIAHASMK